MSPRSPARSTSRACPIRAWSARTTRTAIFVDGDAGLAVLADGMGGYNAGEVASGIAVDVDQGRPAARARVRARAVQGRRPQRAHARRAAAAAADRRRQQGHLRGGAERVPNARAWARRSSPRCSTATACRSRHIGDSRCYRLRGEQLRAADARPLAAAGADRQRPDHRRAGASIRSTRTSSRARSASRRSCRRTSPSIASRPTTSTCCAPTG